jgi:hypothetical protein
MCTSKNIGETIITKNIIPRIVYEMQASEVPKAQNVKKSSFWGASHALGRAIKEELPLRTSCLVLTLRYRHVSYT